MLETKEICFWMSMEFVKTKQLKFSFLTLEFIG